TPYRNASVTNAHKITGGIHGVSHPLCCPRKKSTFGMIFVHFGVAKLAVVKIAEVGSVRSRPAAQTQCSIIWPWLVPGRCHDRTPSRPPQSPGGQRSRHHRRPAVIGSRTHG